MRRWLVTTLLLAACGEGGEFIGDDLGQQVDVGESNPTGTPGSTDVTDATDSGAGGSGPALMSESITCEAIDTAIPGVLDLTAAPGEIAVVHGPAAGPSCAAWTYDVVWADHRVEIAYVDEGTATCVDTCDWTFTYRLTGLQPGTWTVVAETDESTIEVP